MLNQKTVGLLASLTVALLVTTIAHSQQAPDMVVFNAQIITVDNPDFTSDLGTIAEAMAIRDGKILSIGNNAEIQALADSDTQKIDLKGRTVIPGIILVHEHPYDWAGVSPRILKKVITDDIAILKIFDGHPDDQIKAFPDVLREAVKQAKPGQWIYCVFRMGDRYEYSTRGNGWYGLHNTSVLGPMEGGGASHVVELKKTLEEIAPNNPVLLRDTFTGMMLNDKALDETEKVFWQEDANLIDRETGQGGRDGGANLRSIFHDVIMKDHYEELQEIHRLELEYWAGYGMTSFASLAYTPSNIRVYQNLAKNNTLPTRNMWMWNWRDDVFFADQYMINASVFMEGLGDDLFWYGGAQGSEENGRACTTLESRIELTARQQACAFAPGRRSARLLYNYIKSGGRYIGNHTVGDKDVDYILDILTKASQDAGFTLEEIRAKRHGFDHLVMSPRPDQIKRVKNLGMHLGGNGTEVWQAPPDIMAAYGEQALDWVVPRRSLIDAEVHSGFEIDRAFTGTDLTIFWAFARMMDRKAWDGKVYGINQKVNRQEGLKVSTTWGARYMFKEDVLGSLEPGKYADFAVLDRDFLTIPDEDIENIRVLMTVRGDLITHLVPSVAKENGLQPTGAMVELGPASQY